MKGTEENDLPGIDGKPFTILLDREDYIGTMSDERKQEIYDWWAAHWKDEAEKCKQDPYYFYTNYCTINGRRPPEISREEFNSRFPNQ